MNSVATNMDGSLLLSGSEDHTACVWHVPSRQCLRTLHHRGGMCVCICVLLQSSQVKDILSCDMISSTSILHGSFLGLSLLKRVQNNPNYC